MANAVTFADRVISLLFPPTTANHRAPPRPVRPLPTRAAPVPTTNQQLAGGPPLSKSVPTRRSKRRVRPFLNTEAKLQSLNELLAAHRSRRSNLPFSAPLHPRVHTVRNPSARPLARANTAALDSSSAGPHTAAAGTPAKPALSAQGILRRKIRRRQNGLHRSRTIRPHRIAVGVPPRHRAQMMTSFLFPSTATTSESTPRPANPLPTWPNKIPVLLQTDLRTREADPEINSTLIDDDQTARR